MYHGIRINLIAAVGKNFAIGRNNRLLWSIPKDMEWFRDKVTRHSVIMGRKTLESLPSGAPLCYAGETIVLSRNPRVAKPHLHWAENVNAALQIAYRHSRSDDVFVAGGSAVYAAFLEFADRLYLTHVDDAPEADAFFPQFDCSQWDHKMVQEFPAHNGAPSFRICQYDRI